MSAHYQSVIAGAFVDFLDRGYVYKGLKPVHWCITTAPPWPKPKWNTRTTPARPSGCASRSLPIPAQIDPALAGRNVYGLIWTTTPWTMPANMAIAFHPKFEYVAVGRRAARVYIVAADLLAGHRRKVRLGGLRKCSPRFPGAQLEHAVFRHPFLERDSLGILADHVTLEQGTGAVHTAPGHGQEDYVSRRASTASQPIARWMPPAASSTPRARPGRLPEELIGKTVWEANPIVIEILQARTARCWPSKSWSTPIRTAGAATSR